MSQLHQLDKEQLKWLQELNRHLILPNFIVKKRELRCNMAKLDKFGFKYNNLVN